MSQMSGVSADKRDMSGLRKAGYVVDILPKAKLEVAVESGIAPEMTRLSREMRSRAGLSMKKAFRIMHGER